ncbi:hypothetical protein GCM10009795_015170 [Nocardioides hankookensis]
MRKTLTAVLILLGAFFLIMAAMLKFYVGPGLLKTPLNVDTTTLLDGTATLGADPSFPVKATSITRADSDKSDSKVIVWANSSCVVKDVDDPPNCVDADDPQQRLLTASTDTFATDRVTALAVNDRKYIGADATPKEGLVNKFPFETKKQTYPYWDDTSGKAENAVYQGETTIDGVKTYHFQVVITDVPAELTDGVEGTYSNTIDIYVEPLTGDILNQTQEMNQVTDDGANFLTLSLGFTDAQIKDSASGSQDNLDKLKLIRTTLPIVSLIVGLLALIGGIILLRTGLNRPEDTEAAPARESETV